MNPTPEQLRDPAWWREHAPEGATHYDTNEPGLRAWMKWDSSRGWLAWVPDQVWAECKTIAIHPAWALVKRPSEPTLWRGMQDGLPPEGTKCKMAMNATKFVEVRITTYTAKSVVIEHLDTGREECISREAKWEFRPINSDRERLIQKAKEVFSDGDIRLADGFGRMIDVGMLVDPERKPMSRAEAFDLVCEVVSNGNTMKCPECNGDRAVLIGVTGGPDGPIERSEECGLCSGSGSLYVDINEILDALGYKE